MIAAIQYGGRITDDLDQLLMDTYAAKFFHQASRPLPSTCFRVSHIGSSCCLLASIVDIHVLQLRRACWRRTTSCMPTPS